MGRKLMIAAALTGTAGSKKLSEHIPVTAEEIAADAVACARAGAAMVHIHVHDREGKPSMATEDFEEAFHALQKAKKEAGVDFIINLTSSGGWFPDELRLASIKKLQPEMCSYDSGTFNWGCGGVFVNTPEFLVNLGNVCKEGNVKPEIEIFDTGMLGNALEYIKRGVLKAPCHFQFVLGVLGAMDGTVENLDFLRRKLPEGSTWSVTGIGKAHMPMLLAGLAMGCDGVRVGLEDNLYLSQGVKATNAQLVARAAELGRLAGREIAAAAETREILGIAAK